MMHTKLCKMEQLLEQAIRLLRLTSTNWELSLGSQIQWKLRLIGLVGVRGAGKSALLLQ